MATCDNCGGHVSSRFKRVMSIDGEVEGCINCTQRINLMDELTDQRES